jgi:hypothetical protein
MNFSKVNCEDASMYSCEHSYNTAVLAVTYLVVGTMILSSNTIVLVLCYVRKSRMFASITAFANYSTVLIFVYNIVGAILAYLSAFDFCFNLSDEFHFCIVKNCLIYFLGAMLNQVDATHCPGSTHIGPVDAQVQTVSSEETPIHSERVNYSARFSSGLLASNFQLAYVPQRLQLWTKQLAAQTLRAGHEHGVLLHRLCHNRDLCLHLQFCEAVARQNYLNTLRQAERKINRPSRFTEDDKIQNFG